jgi:hypothetical protein
MGVGLPIDAVRAEIESWPLASPKAFRDVVTRLVLEDSGVLAGATRGLWSELEDALRLRAGRVSLAELTPIRDDAWFSAEKAAGRSMQIGELPLHAYLRRLAASVLTLSGGTARLRDASRGPSGHCGAACDLDTNGDHSDEEAPSHAAAEPDPMVAAVERWRWMSLHLPPDLLLAAAAAEAGELAVPAHVDLMPAELAAQLNRLPVAEQHLHIGAGPSVPMLWDALTEEASFPKPLDGELPMADFTQRLLAAGFTRRVLTEHVGRPMAGTTVSFDDTLLWFAEECARRRGRAAYDWRRDSQRLLRVLLEPETALEPLHWMSRARARLPLPPPPYNARQK